MMSAHVRELAALALQYRLPSIYWQKAYTAAGGLMSYGPDIDTIVRRAADYVDKIVRGEKPSDLPGRTTDQLRLYRQPSPTSPIRALWRM
jgi:putative tryptophan/tyrosine transport system substrate-binding protein